MFDALLALAAALVVRRWLLARRELVARRRAEASLRESEERFAMLANATTEAVALHERGTLLDVNDVFCEMFAMPRERAIGASALEFVAEESTEVVVERLRNPADEPLEVTLLRTDGTTFPALIRARTARYRGRPVRVTVVRDLTQQRRVEAAAREAEELYRSLVEQIPLVTYIDEVDEASSWGARSIYISPQVERMLGYAREEFQANRGLWAEILHPDDLERSLGVDRQVYEMGYSSGQEIRLIAKDGRIVWVYDHSVLIPSEPGQPQLVQGFLLDITERKLAEEALHRREVILETVALAAGRFLAARWEDVIGEVLQGIGEAAGASRAYLFEDRTDPDTGEVLTYQRAEWCAPGVTPQIDEESMQGFSYREMGFEDWLAAWRAGEARQALVRDLPAHQAEFFAEQDIRSLAIVPVLAGEAAWGFVGFDDCVTERQWSATEIDALKAAAAAIGAAIGRERAERAMAETENRYRSLVEQIEAVTYVEAHEEGDNVLYMSPQVEKMFGFPLEDWMGRTTIWERQIHEDDLQRVYAEDARTLESGDPFVVDYRMLTKDGRTVWVHEISKLVRDESGTPRYWQGVLFDITERKRTEESLRGREAILEAVAFAAARFLAAPWEDVIDEVLARLGLATRVSRVYVFESRAEEEGGELLSYQRSEWCADGIVPQIDNPALQGLSYRQLGAEDWMDELAAGRTVSARVRDLDGSRAALLEAQDILSIALVPIFAGGGLWGFMGFDDCAVEREWSPAEIDALTAAASALGATIAGERADLALAEAEAKYRTLVEELPAVPYIDQADASMMTLYVGPQVEEVLGVTQEEYLSDNDLWIRRIHPEDRERVLARYRAFVDSDTDSDYLEYRWLRPDGRTVWINDLAAKVRDRDGRVLMFQGALFDVTEGKQAEAALAEAERRFRTVVEQIPAVTYVWDAQPGPGMGDFVYISPQVRDMLGVAPEEWVSRPELWFQHMHAADMERVCETWRDTDVSGKPWAAEYRMVRRDGAVVWVHDQAVAIESDGDGRPRLWQGVVFDVTERKLSEQQRQLLLTRLVQAQEDERRRIAADIHDDPVQKMTAVGLRLEALRNRVSDPELVERMAQLGESVSVAITHLRQLLFELRPPTLDREGIAPALGEYLDQVADESSLETRLDNKLVQEPPIEVRILAYRIAQEAITNARKHSSAKRVAVTLEPRDGGLFVRVRDDGKGLACDQENGQVGHMGMLTMRERAELAGGWFRVASPFGGGTSIEFWLPAQQV